MKTNIEQKDNSNKSTRKPWTREELLLALFLYCSESFGRLHRTNPAIIQIAKAIGRTPSAVAMKACNFASLDPALSQKGLGNASAADRAIWNEFFNDSVSALNEIGKIAQSHHLNSVDALVADKVTNAETEVVREVKVRRIQGFFRKSVLTSYANKCAISGIDIPELLIASHIIPWAESEPRRGDPTNGIALNALYDKAFDRGFISFDENCRVMLSRSIIGMEKNKKLINHLFTIEGQQMLLPTRFQPDQAALAWHRENRFER